MVDTPQPTPHPGEYLRRDFMPQQGLTLDALIRAVPNLAPERLSRVVLGEEPVTGEIAEELARVFDTSPDLWLGLQKAHDLSVLTISAKVEAKEMNRRR